MKRTDSHFRTNDDLPAELGALRTELARLDVALEHVEEWRVLQQLRAARLAGVAADNGHGATRSERVLLSHLADNPLVLRRDRVLGLIAEHTGAIAPAARAEPTAPAAKPDGVDDLTRIRGIDANLARRLRGVGVASFAQIERWTSVDVRRVSEALNLGRAIHAQGWIEQAALLAQTSVQAAKAEATATPAASPSKATAAPLPAKRASDAEAVPPLPSVEARLPDFMLPRPTTAPAPVAQPVKAPASVPAAQPMLPAAPTPREVAAPAVKPFASKLSPTSPIASRPLPAPVPPRASYVPDRSERPAPPPVVERPRFTPPPRPVAPVARPAPAYGVETGLLPPLDGPPIVVSSPPVDFPLPKTVPLPLAARVYRLSSAAYLQHEQRTPAPARPLPPASATATPTAASKAELNAALLAALTKAVLGEEMTAPAAASLTAPAANVAEAAQPAAVAPEVAATVPVAQVVPATPPGGVMAPKPMPAAALATPAVSPAQTSADPVAAPPSWFSALKPPMPAPARSYAQSRLAALPPVPPVVPLLPVAASSGGGAVPPPLRPATGSAQADLTAALSAAVAHAASGRRADDPQPATAKPTAVAQPAVSGPPVPPALPVTPPPLVAETVRVANQKVPPPLPNVESVPRPPQLPDQRLVLPLEAADVSELLDDMDYEAFRSTLEEASVEIVRADDPRPAPLMPAVAALATAAAPPPNLVGGPNGATPAAPDALTAAQAAMAQAAGRAAGQPEPAKPASPMGRFLKALTGQ